MTLTNCPGGLFIQWRMSLQSVLSRDHMARYKLRPDSEVRSWSKQNAETMVCAVATGSVRLWWSCASYWAWATSFRLPRNFEEQSKNPLWARVTQRKNTHDLADHRLCQCYSGPQSRSKDKYSMGILQRSCLTLTMRLRNSLDLPPVRPADDTSRTVLYMRWVISLLDNCPVFENS